jgi:serine protease Do
MAIGNPFGLSRTVTVGIVSAKERVIGQGPYDDFIQTDAAINLGNSGGPLVNIYGEVIGINTAIVAQGTGIGFAVPINMAKDILPELKEKGSVTRGWLGVSIQDVTPEIAESLNLRSEEGALVADVVQGDPAEKAGIDRGDVIIEFDGKKVESSRKLSEIVAKTSVGKKVSVKVVRDGKEKVIKVTVGKMKERKVAHLEKAADELGMEIQDITPDLQEELGQEEGVVVIHVDPVGLASDAGIRKGDVIKEINRRKIKDIDDYRDAVSELKKGQTILFLVNRRGTNLYSALKYKG